MSWSQLERSPEEINSSSRSALSRKVTKKPTKKTLVSKSSMMGVLGVVPEEDNSDDPDAEIQKFNFQRARTMLTQRTRN